ncbi:hypothetical protein [Actinomadura rupiterrae]|uniref:hypothetical protein n=1 Tax=Actinomadura rupiterrae TaxID=559627 RepID=UPI0020A5DA8A|nr:hypothetical protein [Actinomadura rupiterrae]MCP2337539.1 hypothetical protein [Actinomadura rupiterrae]
MNESLVINQLLGRLCYFHVQFIEPRRPRPSPPSEVTCCRHPAVPAEFGPWAVLRDIAADLGVPRDCPADAGGCCAVCRVRTYATAIAECWASTESRAYGVDARPETNVQTRTVGDQIASRFASLTHTACSRPPLQFRPHSATGLPLTDELLTLWAAPGEAPVTSALNHCASLDDVVVLLKDHS